MYLDFGGKISPIVNYDQEIIMKYFVKVRYPSTSL